MSGELTYQHRVGLWMNEVFAAGGADLRTRLDRLIEELFELAQAHGYDPARIATIRDYVYGRPVGDPLQEMGGVMVTLASFAACANIDMRAEGERELARVHTPEVKAKIMAKQASKNALHTPLPTAEAALLSAQPVLDGEWVVVPREPTEAMLHAIGDAVDLEGWYFTLPDARAAYAAMLSSLPDSRGEPKDHPDSQTSGGE